MNIAIDTNRLSDLFDAEPSAARAIQASRTVYLPIIVVGEYKYGIYAGSRKKRNLELLEKFIDRPSCRLLFVDEMTAEHFARLRAYLKEKGQPIPINDIWIAALCVQHDLPLLTRDKDFQKLPQVTLL